MNNNRLFIACVVLILGFLVFAFSLVQSSNKVILDRVAMQQETILHTQQRLASKLNNAPLPAAGATAEVTALQNQIQALETRLASLETDAKPIIDQVKAQRAQYEQQRKEMEEEMKKVYDIEIGSSPVRGKKDAASTLVIFSDFQCPYCSRFHSVSLELLKAYPDKMKVILKNYPLPFHPEAKPAAKAVLAAKEQGKYWEMVDAILKDNTALNSAKYEELAKSVGLNLDKFRKDLKEKDAQFEKIIQADIDLGNKVKVRGTPTFYLNGHKIQPDLEAMKKTIEEASK